MNVNTALLQSIWFFSSTEEQYELVEYLIFRLYIGELLYLENKRLRASFMEQEQQYSNSKFFIFERIVENILMMLGIEGDLETGSKIHGILEGIWAEIDHTEVFSCSSKEIFDFSSYDPPQSELEKFYSTLKYSFI